MITQYFLNSSDYSRLAGCVVVLEQEFYQTAFQAELNSLLFLWNSKKKEEECVEISLQLHMELQAMCALLGQQAHLPSTIYHANEASRTSPKSPFPDVSQRHRVCLPAPEHNLFRSPSPFPLLIRRWVAQSSITHEEEPSAFMHSKFDRNRKEVSTLVVIKKVGIPVECDDSTGRKVYLKIFKRRNSIMPGKNLKEISLCPEINPSLSRNEIWKY
ncbi:hypothetical protein HNY73_019516 [Argiope bruennichi]|uniref:Uncharacterized protein n=1 Tax=Argiope bruennichi TaxID=94029 RepID=A0A8T0E857_ARGBR|nr:hypothetical protein HNY73_019516 [Argiope bruennichi]